MGRRKERVGWESIHGREGVEGTREGEGWVQGTREGEGRRRRAQRTLWATTDNS